MRPDNHLNFSITEGTAALVGVAVFIDVDATVNLTTLEQNTDKLFTSLWIHASPMTGTAMFR